jgi:hypothetical protein
MAAKDLAARKTSRPVIIVMTITGGGQPQDSQMVMDTLQKTGAMVNVIHVSNSDVGQVLGDGPRQTGGLLERVGGSNGLPKVTTKVTNALLQQYVLSYTLADGVKPSDRLSVSTSRKGVTLYTPTRIPTDK